MTVLNTQIAETINITENGQYDVARYTTANVSTPVAPAHYIEKTVDANGKLINSTTNIINLNGATDVGPGVLAYAYYGVSFPANTSIDLSPLTTLSGTAACNYMFAYCTGITSVNLSSLTTVSANTACYGMFSDCAGLKSVDLSGITNLSGPGAFQSIFYHCSSLTTVYIGGTTAIDFGTYVNQLALMFSGCTQNIDVYAPAASQTKISSMSGYPKFGATGTVTWHWRS